MKVQLADRKKAFAYSYRDNGDFKFAMPAMPRDPALPAMPGYRYADLGRGSALVAPERLDG